MHVRIQTEFERGKEGQKTWGGGNEGAWTCCVAGMKAHGRVVWREEGAWTCCVAGRLQNFMLRYI